VNGRVCFFPPRATSVAATAAIATTKTTTPSMSATRRDILKE
jgi:hypothetical protein